MKNFYAFLIAIFATSLGFGQTTVDFDNLSNWNPGTTSYGNYTYTDGTFTATGVDVLRNGTTNQDGFPGALGTYSVRLRNNASTSLTMIVSTGGISTFSFEVRRWDGSPATDFSVETTTDNGSSWTPSSTINSSVTNDSDWKTINGTINSGNNNIGVRIISNGTTERLMVDNFTWTAYSASTPIVGFDTNSSTENETNSTFTVDIPVTLSNYSADVDLSVTVNGSSTAEGGDYTLNTTELNFTADGTLNISLDINADADSDDETIILDITETSATGITISTSQHTITVIDDDLPSASIPYNEDFSDCGTQEWTVATVGADTEWTCGSGYFEANAFGSTGPADDYLISPSFDMDAQTGEILSFNSSTSFADVTSPQIELLYTTNYTGDPSTTTWVDTLSPTWPANDSSGNSGNIDISGISGTAVHFAFRYTSTGTGGGTTEAWRIEDFDITTASTPSITLSESTLSGFDYADGSGPSAEQTFTAEGSSLTTDITITAPADFEVSTTSGSGFGSSVTLTETAGTVTTTTIYVRLASGLSVNTYSGTLSATSTGATQQDISLSGDVTFVSCAGTSTAFPFNGVSGNTNLEHDSGNPPGNSGEACGTNYLIYYNSAPSTDGSGNYLRSNAVDGLIESSDWGGEGNFETFAIDVSGETSIDIETFGSTVGDPFNAGGEQFQWWYKLDGGSATNLGSVFDSSYQGSLAVGPTTIDVTGVNEIIVGFTFSFNGSGGFEDADVTVTTTPTVFTYNGSWSPSDPNGSATVNDNIVVDSGDAVISTNTDISMVTVNPGASLTINTGVTLTANSTTLESVSNSYSSLIIEGTGSLTGSVSYARAVNSYTNDATNNDNDLISAPVTGQAFGSFDSANTNLLASGSVRAFAPFNNNTDVYENYDATTNAATTLDAATGYRAATTDGATLTFTGTVNTGDVLKNITIGTGASYAEWNLIGNPYPSYIDVEAFLTHVVSTQTSGERNIDLLDALSGIYGYDGDASDGWDIITLANDAGRYLAPGQGFFVAASGNGTLIADHDIEFTAAMRTTGTSDDFIAGRNNNPLTFIELKAYTANNDYSTEFYFDADASQGLDPGYDAVIWGGSAPSFALYSHLVQDNTGLPIALQALSDTDYNNVIIPLGVNANMSEQLTFSIVENTLPASIEVYLDDTLTSTSTLLNASDYVLTPSEDLNGTGRFYLRFSNSALSITNTVFEGVSIYTHQSNKTVTIAGQLTEGTSANVYDIQGRVVASKALASNTTLQTIDVSNLNTGVYIVKLANGNTVKTQKIILK
ncbi:T9SS-dependent choice-of-anchor J family protein [Winogradskyella sp. MH6]|uniref:T9SS-dependent choice-of-anchor J family protein n=1 Tax=Winogradskyella sp. MH6 TaxID=2929510 RepID=UPI001FB1CB46|nr:choice-of-anchor J domain-containing protein [Winogradskyella sp. MH6]